MWRRRAGILPRTTLTRPAAATPSGFPIRDSGFPKGNDPGIRNLESGIRNPQMAHGAGDLRRTTLFILVCVPIYQSGNESPCDDWITARVELLCVLLGLCGECVRSASPSVCDVSRLLRTHRTDSLPPSRVDTVYLRGPSKWSLP